MEKTDIHLANEQEKDLTAHLLATSEPWLTLRISEEQCRRNCHNPECLLYMAYRNARPAGIILLDPHGIAGSPYIKSIAVYPDFRGEGIGTMLLSFAEDIFRAEAKHIFICVSSFNKRARKLYERFGFQAAGEFRDFIIEGASEILMHKRI